MITKSQSESEVECLNSITSEVNNSAIQNATSLSEAIATSAFPSGATKYWAICRIDGWKGISQILVNLVFIWLQINFVCGESDNSYVWYGFAIWFRQITKAIMHIRDVFKRNIFLFHI